MRIVIPKISNDYVYEQIQYKEDINGTIYRGSMVSDQLYKEFAKYIKYLEKNQEFIQQINKLRKKYGVTPELLIHHPSDFYECISYAEKIIGSDMVDQLSVDCLILGRNYGNTTFNLHVAFFTIVLFNFALPPNMGKILVMDRWATDYYITDENGSGSFICLRNKMSIEELKREIDLNKKHLEKIMNDLPETKTFNDHDTQDRDLIIYAKRSTTPPMPYKMLKQYLEEHNHWMTEDNIRQRYLTIKKHILEIRDK